MSMYIHQLKNKLKPKHVHQALENKVAFFISFVLVSECVASLDECTLSQLPILDNAVGNARNWHQKV